MPQSVPLECWRAKAGQEAARILDIAPGAPITIVRRVLKFNGKPVVVDEIYLPGDIFQGLSLEVLQEYQASLYSLFETRFGVRMIVPRSASAPLRRTGRRRSCWRWEEGSPLLSVERVTYTYGDKPVEWRRGLYSTAEHYYLNELI
ncbi:MAG: UTRA domain-containing protein [Rhodocyclaceae bacterium]|nr:UTRA domain-containing protein [Rhodocyclaceae bacterium]